MPDDRLSPPMRTCHLPLPCHRMLLDTLLLTTFKLIKAPNPPNYLPAKIFGHTVYEKYSERVHMRGQFMPGAKWTRWQPFALPFRVRLKYSPRIASNEKEIVRNEADTPTSPPGKDTCIGRRNIDNSSSSTLENFAGH